LTELFENEKVDVFLGTQCIYDPGLVTFPCTYLLIYLQHQRTDFYYELHPNCATASTAMRN